MKLKLIYNPAAGRGRAKHHAREVEHQLRSLGADVEPYASTSPADLTRAAGESSRGAYDRVVICGGDGTLNLALRDFDLARGTLALVPLGSGDDFARVNGIPREVGQACVVAVKGVVREVDVALANNLRYAGVAGLGFDSEVARYANERVKHLRGSAVYLYAILRVLPSFRPRRVRIDGRDEEIMFCVFGNSPQYGGGIRITPDAVLDDDQLDACIVHRTSRFQLLRTLPLAYNGTHVKRTFVETRRAREFQVESESPMDVYADGEPLTTTPVRFSVADQKLRMVVNRSE
ncbi:MAG TPA: diacylglycerol kinase family protein [Thermoanaerobaculia bacterium]|nr:diacylglycerol kinase family protein [Thermoanaerobaculia bacterium]